MEVIVIILTLLSVRCDSIPVRQPEVIVVACPEGKPEFPVILEHPTNCNQFFICSFLHPVLKTCPPGLVFDASVDVCNWPWAVDCDPKKRARENTIVIVETADIINDTDDEAINDRDTVQEDDLQSEDGFQGASFVTVDTDGIINEGVKINDTEDEVQINDAEVEAIIDGDTVQEDTFQSEVQGPSSVTVDTNSTINEGVKIIDTDDDVQINDGEDEAKASVTVDTDNSINEGVKINDTENLANNIGDTLKLYDLQSEDVVQGPSFVTVDNEGFKINDTKNEAIYIGDTVQLHDHQSEDEFQEPSSVTVNTYVYDEVKINDTKDKDINFEDSVQKDNLQNAVQVPSSVIVDTNDNINEGVKINDTKDEAINIGDTVQLYYNKSDNEVQEPSVKINNAEHESINIEDNLQSEVEVYSSVTVGTHGNINEVVIDTEDGAIDVGVSPQLYDSSDFEILLNVSEHPSEDELQEPSSVIVDTNVNIKEGVKITDTEDETMYIEESAQLYDGSDIDRHIDVIEDQIEDKIQGSSFEDIAQGTTSLFVETDAMNKNGGIKINDKLDEVASEIVHDIIEHRNEDGVQDSASIIVDTDGNMNDRVKIMDKEDEATNVSSNEMVRDYENHVVYLYDRSDIETHQHASDHQSEITSGIVETNDNIKDGIKINDKGDEAVNAEVYENDNLQVYGSSEIVQDISEQQSETTSVIVETNDTINDEIKINYKSDEVVNDGVYENVNSQVYGSSEIVRDSSEHQNEDGVEGTTSVIALIVKTNGNMMKGVLKVNNKVDEAGNVGEYAKSNTTRTVNNEHLNVADHEENDAYDILNRNGEHLKEARNSEEKNYDDSMSYFHYRYKNNYANLISNDDKNVSKHKFIIEDENDFKKEDIAHYVHHKPNDNFNSNFKEYDPFDKNRWFREKWENGLIYFKNPYWFL